MATVDQSRPSSASDRYKQMAAIADRRFAAGAILLPIALPVVGYLSGDYRILFTIHLFMGAFWFGVGLLGAVVLGPVMGSLSEPASEEFSRRFVPKMTLLMEPVSLGVVGSGVGLAGMLGMWDSPSPTLWLATGLAAALLLLGFGPLHRFTTEMFDEIAAAETDHDRLAKLNKRYGMLSLVELVLMIAVVATMSGLRWGI